MQGNVITCVIRKTRKIKLSYAIISLWKLAKNKKFSRSSRLQVVCKKGVLENFAKFTGKNLCQSLFFNKVEGLRPASFLKTRLWQRCFRVNIVKCLRTPSFYTLPVAASDSRVVKDNE